MPGRSGAGTLPPVDPLLVYFNPRCDTARGTVELLAERDVPHTIVEYLHEPPGRSGLERILDAIPDPPADLVRKDKRFEELGLHAADYTDREAVIDLLVEHPELMQRPVVFRGEQAVIARPKERVLDLLDAHAQDAEAREAT